MQKLLSGKKTYIASGLALAVCGLWISGAISAEIASQSLVALGFGGLITLRASNAKTDVALKKTHTALNVLARISKIAGRKRK